MEKYRHALVQTIRYQLKSWFDQNHDNVSNYELYRFLHSMKGTASTIGLGDIDRIADKLMKQINEDDPTVWEMSELQTFLFELASTCYESSYEDTNIEQETVFSIDEDVPTILLIDDEISMLMYLKEELEKQGWHVVATADPERAIAFFYDYKPDCVIIDVYLKEKTGFGVLNILNHKLTQQFVPQIMISVDKGKEVRMKSYELGADDFIAKPFDSDEFITRVGSQLKRKALVDKLVLVDELSRVYNRRYFNTYFERLCSDLSRKKEPFCIAMLDLDYFKKVNDRYGHLVGDHVLHQFASYIDDMSRTSDTVFRFGGEEFVMLFPNTKNKEAKFIIDRLLEGFSKRTFESMGSQFYVTFSAGITEVSDPNSSADRWLQAADEALYRAKEKGRDQVKVWNENALQSLEKRINVAIIDDDPIIRTILVDILTRISNEDALDIEISSFRSGLELLEKKWYQPEQEGLMILDGMMPDMDGVEVLEHIRPLNKSGKCSILMLTSRKSERDISQALALGADDYMTKPFNINVLESRIRRLIRKLS